MKNIKVAYIIDNNQLVLNVGKNDGIEPGQRFLIYGLSEEDIIDPETNQSLGKLELVRGTGAISYIQDSMSIIKTDMKERSPLAGLVGNYEVIPFSNPQIGDFAREI